jgi:hypothetical protein
MCMCSHQGLDERFALHSLPTMQQIQTCSVKSLNCFPCQPWPSPLLLNELLRLLALSHWWSVVRSIGSLLSLSPPSLPLSLSHGRLPPKGVDWKGAKLPECHCPSSHGTSKEEEEDAVTYTRWLCLDQGCQ